MDDNLAKRFFDEGLTEEVKDRVVDVLVLPDFTSHDEALKIRVILDELVPSSFAGPDSKIPTLFEDFPVEVIEDDPMEFANFNKGRRSPAARYHEIIRAGISCGGRGTTNGTIGAIVFDQEKDGAPSILSNWHVLRGQWRMFRGRTTDVFQPGRLIGGTPFKNRVATFARRAGQNIDAAIATLNDTRPVDHGVFPTEIRFSGARSPKVGDVLEKSGSRTSVTRGQVQRVSGNRVHLVPIGGDSYDAREISKSGDSGSVWYFPDTAEAAVLHTYGDPDGQKETEWAAGYDMTVVADALNFTFS